MSLILLITKLLQEEPNENNYGFPTKFLTASNRFGKTTLSVLYRILLVDQSS